MSIRKKSELNLTDFVDNSTGLITADMMRNFVDSVYGSEYVTSVSGDFSFGQDDTVIFVDTTTQQISGTLPNFSLSGYSNKKYIIKNVGAAGNNLIIKAYGANTIDGTSSFSITDSGSVLLQKSATEWKKINFQTGTVSHNDTTSKQGGTTNEFYHLTSQQNIYVSGFTSDPQTNINNLSATDISLQSQINFLDSDIIYLSGVVDSISADVISLSANSVIAGHGITKVGQTISVDKAASFSWSGTHTFSAGTIIVKTPTSDNEAATKAYVDLNTSGDLSLTARVNTISADLNIVSGDLNTAESDIVDLRTDVNTISANVNTISGNLNTLTTNVNTISANVNTISGNLNTLTTNVNTISGDLNTAESDILSISGDLNTAESDIVDLRTDVNTISGDLNIAESDIITLSGAVQALSVSAGDGLIKDGIELRVDETFDFNWTGVNTFSGGTIIVKTPTSDNEAATKAYVDLNTSGDLSLTAKVNTISGNLNIVSGDLNTAESDIVDLRTDVDTISGNVNTISGNLNTLTTNVNTISANVNTISGNLNTVTTNVNTISANVNTISGNLNTVTTNVNTISANVNTISGDLNNAESDILTLSGNLNTVTTNVNTISANVNTISGNLNTLTTNVNTISANVNTISGDLNTAESDIINISGDLNIAESDIITLSGAVEALSVSAISVSAGDGLIKDGVELRVDETFDFNWTGTHTFSGGTIIVKTPTSDNEAATKAYVDLNTSGDLSLTAKVNTISGNLNIVSGDLNTAESDILTLSGNLNTVTTNVNTISANVNTISGNLTTLTTNVNTISGDLNIAESDIVNLRTDVNTISGNTNTISGNLTTLTTNVNTISANVNTISGNLNTLTTNVNTISGNVITISGNLNTVTTNVNTISANVNTISGNLNTITTNVNTISGNLNIVSGDVISLETLNTNSHKTGFVNRTDTSLSFTEATSGGTVTINKINNFTYYINGVEYVKTASETIALADTEGIWYIYYNGSTLTANQTHPGFFNNALVAIILWDATNNKIIYRGDERHKVDMNTGTHLWAHNTIGCRYETGLAAGNYTIVGTGNNNTDATISFSSGTIFDEDIEIGITHSASPSLSFEQILSISAFIPVYYRTGTNGDWRKDTATGFPVKQGTARIQYNVPGTPWTTADATNGNYVAMWVFATNSVQDPIKCILGQVQDTTLLNAQNNNIFSNLSLGTLPFQEIKILYRLIFQTGNSGGTNFTNTPHARLREVLDYRATSLIASTAFIATSHNSLAGRSDVNSHPSTAISTDVTDWGTSTNLIPISATDVQLALNSLGNISSVISGDLNIAESDIVNLRTDVNTVSGNVNTISGNLNTVTTNVNTISANVNTISGNLNTLTTNVNTISANVNTISGNLNTLTTNVNTISANVNTISGNLNTVTTNVNTISANVNTISGNLNTLTTNVNTISGDLISLTDTVSNITEIKWEDHTITSGDVTNKYFNLSISPAVPDEVVMDFYGGLPAMNTTDFAVSGSTVYWGGLLLDGFIISGDKLRVGYSY